MRITLPGIVMLANPMQPENAEEPILVTLLGIVMLASSLQLEKAEVSMLVTLHGIVMLFRLLQSENTEDPMLVPPVIVTSLTVLGIFPDSASGIVKYSK